MVLFANLPFLSSLLSTAARARRRSVALGEWPRERVGARGSEGEEWRMRKGSAATEESTGSIEESKEMDRSDGSGRTAQENHERVVAAMLPVMVRRLSVTELAEDMEIEGVEIRPPSVDWPFPSSTAV